jgi:hypothetical protein
MEHVNEGEVVDRGLAADGPAYVKRHVWTRREKALQLPVETETDFDG